MSKERFVKKYSQGNAFTTLIQVIIDCETGVNYVIMKDGYGGGICPLLDEKGNVIITPASELEK